MELRGRVRDKARSEKMERFEWMSSTLKREQSDGAWGEDPVARNWENAVYQFWSWRLDHEGGRSPVWT